MKNIVCDTGALISLEKLNDGYEFAQKLYDKLIIPPEVLKEAAFYYSVPEDYFKKYNIEHFIEIVNDFPILKNLEELDNGEIEAISLAKFLSLELLIEEQDGRRLAQKLKIKISGIAGQIIKAFKKGLIDKIEALEKLKKLHIHHRLNSNLYKELKKMIKH